MGFATQTLLRVVLSVVVGWGRVGFATQTVLHVVLSVGLGRSGFCNTDRVACGPVCGVGVEWVLQHRPCYVRSCLWGWGGVGCGLKQ